MSNLKVVPGDGKHRPIYQYAEEIANDWGFKISNAALPYLTAMASIDQIEDTFGYDTAVGIVLRFLANAQGWRGPVARQLKAELKAIVDQRDDRLADKNHGKVYE